jgi:hypothetical protein
LFIPNNRNERRLGCTKIIHHMHADHCMKIIPLDFMFKIKLSINNQPIIDRDNLIRINSLRVTRYMQENNPDLGSFSFSVILTPSGNPILPSFSIRVQNTAKCWSFCKNKADLDLSHRPPMPLQSIRILPYSLIQTEPGSLAERECKPLFFSDMG